MRDAIHKAGVNSTVFFELRFIPHFELINACMDQGLLGDVHYLEVDYYHGDRTLVRSVRVEHQERQGRQLTAHRRLSCA
jgi:predicted dehydrogenase